MLFPYAFWTGSWHGVWTALLQVISITAELLVVYKFGGIMAGDVKLIGLIAGFLDGRDIAKYVILVFYIAGFMGVIKVIFNYISEENEASKRTTIRFTAPILIAYLILYLTKGGL